MLKPSIIATLVIIMLSCKEADKENSRVKRSQNEQSDTIERVEIEDILVDSLLNVRALEVRMNNGEAAFATSNGRIGFIKIDSKKSGNDRIANYKVSYLDTTLTTGNKNENFRSLALLSNSIIAVNIESPAHIYKVSSDDEVKVVYAENNEKAFYDSADFWNENEGIAIGDATDNCISILITRDGGENWKKMTCDSIGSGNGGEASFAASDTNISIIGDKAWVATGGKYSMIYYSSDRGKTWEVYDTPIVQGGEMTGIYSIDFYDEMNGFGIGGDYTKPDSNKANKIKTVNGGKNWVVVADSLGPGYRSCIQYIPNGNANKLVAIGFKGIDYSADQGESWKHLSDEGFYTLRFVNDSVAFAAGKGRISKLVFK